MYRNRKERKQNAKEYLEYIYRFYNIHDEYQSSSSLYGRMISITRCCEEIHDRNEMRYELEKYVLYGYGKERDFLNFLRLFAGQTGKVPHKDELVTLRRDIKASYS